MQSLPAWSHLLSTLQLEFEPRLNTTVHALNLYLTWIKDADLLAKYLEKNVTHRFKCKKWNCNKDLLALSIFTKKFCNKNLKPYEFHFLFLIVYFEIYLQIRVLDSYPKNEVEEYLSNMRNYSQFGWKPVCKVVCKVWCYFYKNVFIKHPRKKIPPLPQYRFHVYKRSLVPEEICNCFSLLWDGLLSVPDRKWHSGTLQK